MTLSIECMPFLPSEVNFYILLLSRKRNMFLIRLEFYFLPFFSIIDEFHSSLLAILHEIFFEIYAITANKTKKSTIYLNFEYIFLRTKFASLQMTFDWCTHFILQLINIQKRTTSNKINRYFFPIF